MQGTIWIGCRNLGDKGSRLDAVVFKGERQSQRRGTKSLLLRLSIRLEEVLSKWKFEIPPETAEVDICRVSRESESLFGLLPNPAETPEATTMSDHP